MDRSRLNPRRRDPPAPRTTSPRARGVRILRRRFRHSCGTAGGPAIGCVCDEYVGRNPAPAVSSFGRTDSFGGGSGSAAPRDRAPVLVAAQGARFLRGPTAPRDVTGGSAAIRALDEDMFSGAQYSSPPKVPVVRGGSVRRRRSVGESAGPSGFEGFGGGGGGRPQARWPPAGPASQPPKGGDDRLHPEETGCARGDPPRASVRHPCPAAAAAGGGADRRLRAAQRRASVRFGIAAAKPPLLGAAFRRGVRSFASPPRRRCAASTSPQAPPRAGGRRGLEAARRGGRSARTARRKAQGGGAAASDLAAAERAAAFAASARRRRSMTAARREPRAPRVRAEAASRSARDSAENAAEEDARRARRAQAPALVTEPCARRWRSGSSHLVGERRIGATSPHSWRQKYGGCCAKGGATIARNRTRRRDARSPRRRWRGEPNERGVRRRRRRRARRRRAHNAKASSSASGIAAGEGAARGCLAEPSAAASAAPPPPRLNSTSSASHDAVAHRTWASREIGRDSRRSFTTTTSRRSGRRGRRRSSCAARRRASRAPRRRSRRRCAPPSSPSRDCCRGTRSTRSSAPTAPRCARSTAHHGPAAARPGGCVGGADAGQPLPDGIER